MQPTKQVQVLKLLLLLAFYFPIFPYLLDFLPLIFFFDLKINNEDNPIINTKTPPIIYGSFVGLHQFVSFGFANPITDHSV